MASITFRASILTLVLLSLGAGTISMGESVQTNQELQSRRAGSPLTFTILPELSARLLPPETLATEHRKMVFGQFGVEQRWRELHKRHSAVAGAGLERWSLGGRGPMSLGEEMGSSTPLPDGGRIVTEVSEFEAPADGVVRGRSTDTIVYDPHGYLVRHDTDVDDGADGTLEERFTYSAVYDEHGHLVQSQVTEDIPFDGTIDYAFTAHREFDQRGDLVVESFETLGPPGGDLNSRITRRLFYDRPGIPTGELREEDSNGDGTIDSRAMVANEYDSRGDLLRQESEYQVTVGTIDFRSLNSTTNEYDPHGNLLQQVIESDSKADGTIDYRETISYVYDSAGNTLRQEDELDNHADGTIEYRALDTRTYDQRSNLVLETMEFTESGGIGRLTTTNVYNQQSNLVQQDVEEVAPFGGRSLIHSILEYDPQGRIIRRVDEADGVGSFNANGIAEERLITTNEYDAQGNLSRQQTDEDKLDTTEIDYRDTTTYRYEGSPRPPSDAKLGGGESEMD